MFEGGLSAHHVDDLGQGDLQGDIERLLRVLGGPQGAGVVGEEVVEQLVGEAALRSPTACGTTAVGAPGPPWMEPQWDPHHQEPPHPCSGSIRPSPRSRCLSRAAPPRIAFLSYFSLPLFLLFLSSPAVSINPILSAAPAISAHPAVSTSPHRCPPPNPAEGRVPTPERRRRFLSPQPHFGAPQGRGLALAARRCMFDEWDCSGIAFRWRHSIGAGAGWGRGLGAEPPHRGLHSPL